MDQGDTLNSPPSDAARINALLLSMGVRDVEPRVVTQLQDFTFKYVSEVLLDAEAYAEHAGKGVGVVEMDDVMLAIQVRGAEIPCLGEGACWHYIHVGPRHKWGWEMRTVMLAIPVLGANRGAQHARWDAAEI